jgi:uncharacterized protein YqjF (DUF2071 family)
VIDRMAPTLRPPGRAAMRMIWADLGFLHWVVPVAVLPVAVVYTWQDATFWKGAFRWQDNLE